VAVHPQKPSQLATNFDYCSRTVVVPQHKPRKPGTLKGVVEQAGLTLEEFVAEL
jgi:hypothetical protein